MKYKIWTLLGKWQEVEGQPFNYPGYEHLGLFISEFMGNHTISEPQTGMAIVSSYSTNDVLKHLFEQKIIKNEINPKIIEHSRDKEIELRKNTLVSVTIQIPQKVYDIFERRPEHDVSAAISKRIIYDTTRKR